MGAQTNTGEKAQEVTIGYAQAFRVIGAALENLEVEDFDLEIKDLEYWIRGCAKDAPNSAPVEKRKFFGNWLKVRKRLFAPQAGAAFELHYTLADLCELELKGRAQRGTSQGLPDAQSLSEILRSVGEFLDLKHVCLSRLSMRGRWITLHYKSAQGHLVVEEHTASSLHSFWIGLCARRAVVDKPAPSPATRKHVRIEIAEQDQEES
jgi:hypothetical protein